MNRHLFLIIGSVFFASAAAAQTTVMCPFRFDQSDIYFQGPGGFQMVAIGFPKTMELVHRGTVIHCVNTGGNIATLVVEDGLTCMIATGGGRTYSGPQRPEETHCDYAEGEIDDCVAVCR